MFRKLPFILLLVIAMTAASYPLMSLSFKEQIYAISLSIQSIILFLLPLIIFSLMFKTMTSLSKQATTIIALILLSVCISNFTSTFLSHYVGSWVYQLDLSILLPKDLQGLKPAWHFALPQLIPNDKAMFLGIILGIIFGNWQATKAAKISYCLDALVIKILNSFVFLIPIFIAGFIIKLNNDGVILTIIKDYTLIFALIACAQFTYILFMYALLNRFNFLDWWVSVKNMLPATIAGFTTMSSAAVMPLTLSGVERNAKNKGLAKSVVPATVNIHLVGDCFAIPIFAYAVMKSFGFAEPVLFDYLVFVMYFVIAKFSVAAIPGGGIVVMLPILQSTLGFNNEMLSLMTALYILFDPVITCANIFGNGAFAKLIDKIVTIKPKESLEPLSGN